MSRPAQQRPCPADVSNHESIDIIPGDDYVAPTMALDAMAADAERDRCGYPAGQEHPHVEQCHRAERERVLAQVEALGLTCEDGCVGPGLCDGSCLRALVASVREATP